MTVHGVPAVAAALHSDVVTAFARRLGELVQFDLDHPEQRRGARLKLHLLAP